MGKVDTFALPPLNINNSREGNTFFGMYDKIAHSKQKVKRFFHFETVCQLHKKIVKKSRGDNFSVLTNCPAESVGALPLPRRAKEPFPFSCLSLKMELSKIPTKDTVEQLNVKFCIIHIILGKGWS